jgi:hypothetical protein
MSDDLLTCQQHGQRPVAFVCQHLLAGSGQGFHWSSEDPDSLCPNAWCDACEADAEQAGGWTDEATAAVARVVCDRCYESLRADNWPDDEAAFEELLARALPFLQERQEQLIEQHQLGEYERFDWNQDSGQLIFSNGGVPQVTADVLFVGSLSTRSDTWRWSWANETVNEPLKAPLREVRRHGEVHGLMKLVAAQWSATEHDGWEMAAIAALLLGAVGAYRAPKEGGHTFLLMMNVRRAQ